MKTKRKTKKIKRDMHKNHAATFQKKEEIAVNSVRKTLKKRGKTPLIYIYIYV